MKMMMMTMKLMLGGLSLAVAIPEAAGRMW